MSADKGVQHKFKRVRRSDKTFMYCEVCGGYAYFDAPSECPARFMAPFESINVREFKLDLYGGVWLWETPETEPTPFIGLH